MNSSFSLGTIFGIRFRLHATWFIIFILVTVLLVYPDFARWHYWLVSLFVSILFFASVVAHELAHSLAGRANGIPVESITLFIFGGIARISQEIPRPSAELKMAASGPMCSLALGGSFGILWIVLPPHIEPVKMMVLWLATMNITLALFNLVPGFPLDGGRMLRSVLWQCTGNYRRSTRIAARLGQGIGYTLIIIGAIAFLLQPFEMTWFDGLWVALVGCFLTAAASASYREALMPRLNTAPPAVPPPTSQPPPY